MVLDINTVIGIGFTAISGVGIYLFTNVTNLSKRVQKIEDVKDLELAAIKKEVADLDKKVVDGFMDINKKLADINANIHKSKNEENQLNATLTAILKHLTHERD
jgi:coproporphyrinogen III oxidase-like Fe-S oxidoreductase